MTSERPLCPDVGRHARHESVAVGVVGVASLGLALWWCIPTFTRLSEESAILADCEHTSDVEVWDEREGGLGPFGWVEVDFAFRTADGELVDVSHGIRVSPRTRPDLGPDVRTACYVPTDPARVVLEPLHALEPQRRESMVLMAWGAGASLVFSIGYLLYTLRLHRRHLAALRTGTLVRATIRAIERNGAYHFVGQTVVRFSVEGSPAEHKYSFIGAGVQPLSSGNTFVAVAGGAGTAPVLLRSDGFPYQVEPRDVRTLAQLRFPWDAPDAAEEEEPAPPPATPPVTPSPRLRDVTELLPAHARRASPFALATIALRLLGKSLLALALLGGMGGLAVVNVLDALADRAAFAEAVPVDVPFTWQSRGAFGLIPSYDLRLATDDGEVELRFHTLFPVDFDAIGEDEVRWVRAEERYLVAAMAHQTANRCGYALASTLIGLAIAWFFMRGSARLVAQLRWSRHLARAGDVFFFRAADAALLPRWVTEPGADVSPVDAPFVVEAKDGRHLLAVLDEETRRFAYLSFESRPLALSRRERAELRRRLQELADGSNISRSQ